MSSFKTRSNGVSPEFFSSFLSRCFLPHFSTSCGRSAPNCELLSFGSALTASCVVDPSDSQRHRHTSRSLRGKKRPRGPSSRSTSAKTLIYHPSAESESRRTAEETAAEKCPSAPRVRPLNARTCPLPLPIIFPLDT
jgi:hypothetical protein